MKLRIPLSRRAGFSLALAAAVISGVSVYVNAIAVKHAPGATSFTAAKNSVAALIIAATFLASSAGQHRPRDRRALAPAQWLGLAFVGIVGGGLAFALFFEGLARADTTQAAFVQKTLVLWVALLAVPLLGERVGWRQVLAIGALMGGLLLLSGDVTQHRPAGGLLLVLAATLLWSVEIVVARALLRHVPATLLGAVRMSLGTLTLIAVLAATHSLGQFGMMGRHWTWALLTGVLLAGYVLTWFGALRRAPAVDVTAILVLGAFITALLSASPAHAVLAPRLAGLALLVVGVSVVISARPGRNAATVAAGV